MNNSRRINSRGADCELSLYINNATVSDFTVAYSAWMTWRYSIRRSPRK